MLINIEEHQTQTKVNQEMLSFLTHSLNNILVGTSQKVRETIRYLLTSEYEKDKRLYDTINNVASLQTTFSVVQNLIQTFKQYINDPKDFQQSWQQDNHGKGTIEGVIAFALSQTLSRIFFHETRELPITRVKKLLYSDADFHFKKLRHSFMDEMMISNFTHHNIQQTWAWIKQHFDIFTFELEATPSIHFAEKGTRFTFLFAIFSEVIFNALKYSDGNTKIKLRWYSTEENYSFVCTNTFNPELRYEQQETQKGLIFVDRLMQMLPNSRLLYGEKGDIFTVKLVFTKTAKTAKTHFEDIAYENTMD